MGAGQTLGLSLQVLRTEGFKAGDQKDFVGWKRICRGAWSREPNKKAATVAQVSEEASKMASKKRRGWI